MNIETILPQWAVTALALGVGMGLGGLSLWLGCQALEKLVRLIRRTLAADLRLEHLRLQRDRSAINGWIRDYYDEKRRTARERRRADQERYNKKQIAIGAENMRRRKNEAIGKCM